MIPTGCSLAEALQFYVGELGFVVPGDGASFT
jgi:hypothetical protein